MVSLSIRVAASMESQSRPRSRPGRFIEVEVEADLLALQQATSFHSFIFVSSLAEDKEILASLIVFSVEMCFIN